MKKILAGLALLLSFVPPAEAQRAVIAGESAAGVYVNIKTDASGNLYTTPAAAGTTLDPCQSPGVAKTSAAISISSATTTALVALSGTTVVYVCGFSMSISQVITTANTLKFVQGTGATCGTGTADITGLFGGGGITASAPIVVSGSGGTVFKTIAGNALCATTAIGASASFQGFITYVQQ